MIHPRKNLPAVRAAVATLAAEGLPHGLVVVGGHASDRQDGRELMAAAAQELPGAPGRVVHLDGIDDTELAGVMARADVICLPSFYEGFGIPVIEAMACGTPAVVSDRGALPEVVGDTGLVVAPDADAVTGALRRLLTEPGLAGRLGPAARERAAEFTWERTVEGWLAVLRTAADEG
jgi:glycosyltransferase involved in cell wall biosynthesis